MVEKNGVGRIPDAEEAEMDVATRARRGLQLFSRAAAPRLSETTMQRSTSLDEPAREALPEFYAGGGSVIKLLFGDPDGADDGGVSLVRVRFGPSYPLPRHSHSVDCLYYVVSGEVRMGKRIVRSGEGFFVPADAPYGYTAGAEGVELLEFRAKSVFDSQIHESRAGWARVLEGVRANRDRWAAAAPSYE
jgi:quercetin dioxygenase-like cupin family protein